MKTPAEQLFDLGMAYYTASRAYTRMDCARYVRGNRTAAYQAALSTLDHACEYLWTEIRSHVVYYGIAGDPILDRAWGAVRNLEAA